MIQSVTRILNVTWSLLCVMASTGFEAVQQQDFSPLQELISSGRTPCVLFKGHLPDLL